MEKSEELVTNYRRRVVIHADMDSTGTLVGTCPPPGWPYNDFLDKKLAGNEGKSVCFWGTCPSTSPLIIISRKGVGDNFQ